MVANRQQEDRVPPAQAGVADDELDLFSYIRVLVKYRWTTVLVCLLAMAAVGTYSYTRRPMYVAGTSIIPPLESAGGKMGLSGLLGGGEGTLLRNVLDKTNAAELYIGILASRTVADAIIDRFDLIHVYDVNGLRYEAERTLRKSTIIKTSDDGVVSIKVEDGDPNRAAAMANAYVEELDRQNKRLSVGQATSKRVFLETRLGEVEQRLRGIDSMPAREVQVQEMLYELLMRELEIARIEEAKSMPTIQILDIAYPPEVRKPRGTVRKAVLAGVMAVLCVAFFAFSREYYLGCRRREQGGLASGRPVSESGEPAAGRPHDKMATATSSAQ